MKYISILAVLLFCQTAYAEKEINVTSNIKEVTVYQQNAQIIRRGKVSIPIGSSTLVFKDLPTSIDQNTLRFTGKGDFTILSVTYYSHLDTISGKGDIDRIQAWNQEKLLINAQIAMEQSFMDVYTRELQMLQANQNFGSATAGVNVADLKSAADFLRNRYIDIRNNQIRIEDKVKALREEITAIDEKIGAIGGLKTKQSVRVLVKIQAAAALQSEVELSYKTYNAGWSPYYDAHVKNIEDPFKLEYKAKVYQSSGEDWKDVKLTIATGNPNLNGTKPILTPWYLNGQVQYNTNQSQDLNAHLRNQAYNRNVNRVTGQVISITGEPLPFVTIALNNGSGGTTTDINGYYAVDVPQGASALSYSFIGYNSESLTISNEIMNVVLKENSAVLLESMVVEVKKDRVQNTPALSYTQADADVSYKANYAAVVISHAPTNTKYKVKTNYSIPSDGQRYSVNINEIDMDAEYLYQCAPKLDPTVYLMARITGWEEHDFLAGTMNIYFEEAFIGTSQLDLNQVGDTMNVSLGQDPSILVSRRHVGSKSNKTLIGSKKKHVREWEFSVQNQKRNDIRIQIEDQLPMASHEEIEIEKIDVSGGKVNEFTGQVTWTFNIDSGKRKDFNFKYAVKHPKNLYVRLD